MGTNQPWKKEQTAEASPAAEATKEVLAEVAASPANAKSAKTRETDGNTKSGTETVVVGCKLPSGIILELIPKAEGWNPPPCGPRVKLAGANRVKQDTLLHVNPRVLEYGHTIVNKSFWDQWVAQNANSSLLKSGFIFAEASKVDFKAHAKEMLPEKTGLEGLNPEGKDDRLKNIQLPGHQETKIETDKEHLARLQRQIVSGDLENEDE